MKKKKISLILLVTVVILSGTLCGCETIGAVRSGNLKKQDIIQMAQLRTRYPKGSIAIEEFVYKLDIEKADKWFYQNFW
ncbi:MAG: hypothetical protein N2606_00515 [Candidatus Omnitrophica bacterium]|nr:hypothetical protein [Candidatus Omnitrophota bacterium]